MTPRLVVPVFCLALLVAGCRETSEDQPAEETTDASVEASAEPDGGAADEDAGAADEDAGAADEDEAAGAGDAFCVSAEAGTESVRALLDATDLKSAETGKEDDSGDVAVMNAQGAIMVESIEDIGVQWREAQATLEAGTWDDTGAEVSTAAVDAAITDYLVYAEGFAIAEAELAASAGSIADYDAGMLAILTDAAAVESAVTGAAALGEILLYTQDRCGALAAFDD